MRKLIITGGHGYIASLINYFNNTKYEITLLDKAELDLSDIEKVSTYFNNADFDLVLHAGAIPDTKTCEDYPDLTYKVNVLSTKKIAEIVKEKNKRMIFISSEQIYNGLDIMGPHSETQAVSSVTAYGNHKIECEEFIKELDFDYLIIRFGWMFGLPFPTIKPSYNILTPIIKAIIFEIPTKFTVNEIRGFTYAHNFAKQFDKISNLPKGIYNITAENNYNTYEAAKKIAQIMGFSSEQIDKNILPNFDRYSDRFRDFHMSNLKAKSFGIEFGDLKDEISNCLEEFGWPKNE